MKVFEACRGTGLRLYEGRMGASAWQTGGHPFGKTPGPETGQVLDSAGYLRVRWENVCEKRWARREEAFGTCLDPVLARHKRRFRSGASPADHIQPLPLPLPRSSLDQSF